LSRYFSIIYTYISVCVYEYFLTIFSLLSSLPFLSRCWWTRKERCQGYFTSLWQNLIGCWPSSLRAKEVWRPWCTCKVSKELPIELFFYLLYGERPTIKNDYFLFFVDGVVLSKDGMTKYYQQLENADVKSVRNGMYLLLLKIVHCFFDYST